MGRSTPTSQQFSGNQRLERRSIGAAVQPARVRVPGIVSTAKIAAMAGRKDACKGAD